MKYDPALGRLGIAMVVTLGSLAILGGGSAATAAETVVMRYGPLSRSIPMADLRQLASTGNPTRQLKAYLRLANQTPNSLQARLNQPYQVNVVRLDSQLNSLPGGLLLDEAGRYIHPPGQNGSRQALRSALVLSAANDNQITLLESLENYPTSVVEVEVDKTLALYRRIDGFLTEQPGTVPIFDFLQRRVRSILQE